MKSLLFFALTLAGINAGFSQGQVNFNNASGAFTFPTQGPAREITYFGVGLTGTNYLAQLYLASDYSAVLVEGPSQFRASTTTQPGTWNGGIRNFLPAYLNGQIVNVVVRIWDGGPGGLTTYENSFLKGESVAFNYTIPAPASPPSQLAMFGFQGFELVPEPSTISLSLLSIGALLFIRRKV